MRDEEVKIAQFFLGSPLDKEQKAFALDAQGKLWQRIHDDEWEVVANTAYTAVGVWMQPPKKSLTLGQLVALMKSPKTTLV